MDQRRPTVRQAGTSELRLIQPAASRVGCHESQTLEVFVYANSSPVVRALGVLSSPSVATFSDVASAHRACQACTVGAGSFDAECDLPTEGSGPLHQLGVDACVSDERAAVEQGAEVVDDDCDVDVLVGVDADDDSTVCGDLLHAHEYLLQPDQGQGE